MRSLTVVLVLVLGACCVAACGSNDHLDGRGARIVDAQIVAARQAAAQGDAPRALTLLRAVEDSVNSLRARRWITDRRAAGILAAVGDAQDAVRAYAERANSTGRGR